jgi:hypothetical protein
VITIIDCSLFFVKAFFTSEAATAATDAKMGSKILGSIRLVLYPYGYKASYDRG